MTEPITRRASTGLGILTSAWLVLFVSQTDVVAATGQTHPDAADGEVFSGRVDVPAKRRQAGIFPSSR